MSLLSTAAPIPSISATRLFVAVALLMFQISALRRHAQYTVLDDCADALWRRFSSILLLRPH